MKKYRIVASASTEGGPLVRVRFRISPRTRCGRIHVPAQVLAFVLVAAGGGGTFQVAQRIVIGSCAREGRQKVLSDRVRTGVAKILRWTS